MHHENEIQQNNSKILSNNDQNTCQNSNFCQNQVQDQYTEASPPEYKEQEHPRILNIDLRTQNNCHPTQDPLDNVQTLPQPKTIKHL